MKLTFDELHLLAQCAASAALQAGRVISLSKPGAVSVMKKQGGESAASQVVTEIDHRCQEIILQTLSSSCRRFDLAVLTEESPDDGARLEKDYFWCIDPLDGTLPFIESTPGYAVSVALVSKDGIPQIGVIFDPVEQTLYQAVKGGGALRNEKPLRVIANIADDEPLIWFADRSIEDSPHFTKLKEAMAQLAMKMGCDGLVHRFQGGAVMNACWVLEKSSACYFKFPKRGNGGGSLWDYAATACVFKEAGATATDIYGDDLDLSRPDSTFMNHRGVLFCSNDALAAGISAIHSELKSCVD